MPLRFFSQVQSRSFFSSRCIQRVALIGASLFTITGVVGCKPDTASAKSPDASGKSAPMVRVSTPSPWPTNDSTHQLRQFTKHAKDLELNPALAMITLFPDKTLPKANITPLGVDMISVDELEALLSQGGWGLLDVRKPADVRKTGVIPGAVHYMYSFEGAPAPADTSMLTREVVSDLMAEYPKGVIVYCNGPKCFRSYNAVLAIVQMWAFDGNRVKWFRGGAPAWRLSPLIPVSSSANGSHSAMQPNG